MNKQHPVLGPFLVSLGAFLWASDAMMRIQVAQIYDPLLIVFLNHLLALPVTLTYSYTARRKNLKSHVLSKKLNSSEWFSLFILTAGGSIAAGYLFTTAYQHTNNYSLPILMQKLQPIFAIGFAALLLKERMKKTFFFWSFLAILGGYLVTFGNQLVLPTHLSEDGLAMLCAVAAAVIWGACTIAGRHLVQKYGFARITSLRFHLASAMLLAIVVIKYGPHNFTQLFLTALSEHVWAFMFMATIPGVIALSIYYYGLRFTKASVATICELSFPLGAILLNWLAFDEVLQTAQWLGVLALLTGVTAVSRHWVQTTTNASS